MTSKNIESLKIISFENDTLIFLDQRLLPLKEEYVTCSSVDQVCEAISTLTVRGAPALGVTGAYGIALSAKLAPKDSWLVFKSHILNDAEKIKKTRPTAINLSWGIQQALDSLNKLEATCFEIPLNEIAVRLLDFAHSIKDSDIKTNKAIGAHGADLILNGDIILTHCNAGALCSAGYGTALGVLYAAQAQGKSFEVYADETRPLLQGSRLTAWELQRHGIPVTVISDNMAAWTIKTKGVTKIITGADRIAKNGDTANKIGTYGLALLAKAHNIPFYIAAPFSTIDSQTLSGSQIPIEERPEHELREFNQTLTTPILAKIFNPAFDVTPANLITGIITEQGVLKPPFHF